MATRFDKLSEELTELRTWLAIEVEKLEREIDLGSAGDQAGQDLLRSGLNGEYSIKVEAVFAKLYGKGLFHKLQEFSEYEGATDFLADFAHGLNSESISDPENAVGHANEARGVFKLHDMIVSLLDCREALNDYETKHMKHKRESTGTSTE